MPVIAGLSLVRYDETEQMLRLASNFISNFLVSALQEIQHDMFLIKTIHAYKSSVYMLQDKPLTPRDMTDMTYP